MQGFKTISHRCSLLKLKIFGMIEHHALESFHLTRHRLFIFQQLKRDGFDFLFVGGGYQDAINQLTNGLSDTTGFDPMFDIEGKLSVSAPLGFTDRAVH